MDSTMEKLNFPNNKRYIWKHSQLLKTKNNFVWDWWLERIWKKNFHWFSGIKKIRRYGKYSSRGAVWGERFERTIRDLLCFWKKFVFEKSNSNWMDEMISVTKKYNHTQHSLTKLTPRGMRLMFTQTN